MSKDDSQRQDNSGYAEEITDEKRIQSNKAATTQQIVTENLTRQLREKTGGRKDETNKDCSEEEKESEEDPKNQVTAIQSLNNQLDERRARRKQFNLREKLSQS